MFNMWHTKLDRQNINLFGLRNSNIEKMRLESGPLPTTSMIKMENLGCVLKQKFNPGNQVFIPGVNKII